MDSKRRRRAETFHWYVSRVCFVIAELLIVFAVAAVYWLSLKGMKMIGFAFCSFFGVGCLSAYWSWATRKKW